MVATALVPGSLVAFASRQCLYGDSSICFASCSRSGRRRRRVAVQSFVDEWLQGRRRRRPEKALPVVVLEGGRRWQYVFDGERMRTVEVEEEARGAREVGESFFRAKQTLLRIFVPDQVRPHYLDYLKWKLVHRFFSSILHFQCTQAMLWAIGVGAKRRLPAAAVLNWVMKDGLGRLGKLIYTASLGRTFDSNLKKVRFSTSALFSLSVGLEIMTPLFPRYFLLLATLAHVAKSIAYAAYLSTSSAIHRSFALGNNLADISAKGQAQTVVADNFGLAVAICLNQITQHHPTIERVFPFITYPFLALAELYAIYNQLQAVHLQTLNKERLEIVMSTWVKDRRIPSFEEVSKVENAALLDFFNGCKQQLLLRIGAVSSSCLTPERLIDILDLHDSQRYALCMEPLSSSPFLVQPSFSQPGLLLWLHEKANNEDIMMGVLQVCQMRAMITSKASLQQLGKQYEKGDIDGAWRNLLVESRQKAEAEFEPLLVAIKDKGWLTKDILLGPKEMCSFSILKH